MGMFSIFDINSAGLSVEQAKLAVAASNIANSRTTHSADGTVYKPLAVTVRASAPTSTEGGVELPRPIVSGIVESGVAPRSVYDPGNPEADAKGFVTLPGVDPISSMLDLMSISRSYEANLRAFDITRTLIERTLEIGRNR